MHTRLRWMVAGSSVTLAPMTTVDEIMTAIEHLTFDERADLARRLHGWEDDAWDRQIAADLDAGQLDGLLQEVDQNIAAGRYGRPREINDRPRVSEADVSPAGDGEANRNPPVPHLAR